MNASIVSSMVAASFLTCGSAFALAQALTPDLKALPQGKGWKGSIGVAKLVDKGGAAAVEFNKPGLNVVWLDGFEFSEGTLEFDAKGKSGPPQSSFIGVAFRIVGRPA